MQWGTAHIQVHINLRHKMQERPYADLIRILRSSPDTDTIDILKVESPLLAPGYHGCQELVIDRGIVKFKKWADLGPRYTVHD